MSRFKLSLDDVDYLLAAIFSTLYIKEETMALSLRDLMYKGLEEPKGRIFPVHKVLSDSIRREWADPERKPFFSQGPKRLFPFDEGAEHPWNKSAFVKSI